MIVETGTVVAIEADSLWVETIQKTACEVCVAQKGCGTRVLSKLTGKTNRIRVLLQQQSADDLQRFYPATAQRDHHTAYHNLSYLYREKEPSRTHNAPYGTLAYADE